MWTADWSCLPLARRTAAGCRQRLALGALRPRPPRRDLGVRGNIRHGGARLSGEPPRRAHRPIPPLVPLTCAGTVQSARSLTGAQRAADVAPRAGEEGRARTPHRRRCVRTYSSSSVGRFVLGVGWAVALSLSHPVLTQPVEGAARPRCDLDIGGAARGAPCCRVAPRLRPRTAAPRRFPSRWASCSCLRGPQNFAALRTSGNARAPTYANLRAHPCQRSPRKR